PPAHPMSPGYRGSVGVPLLQCRYSETTLDFALYWPVRRCLPRCGRRVFIIEACAQTKCKTDYPKHASRTQQQLFGPVRCWHEWSQLAYPPRNLCTASQQFRFLKRLGAASRESSCKESLPKR